MAEREPWKLSNEESPSKGASGGAWAAAFVSATIALLAASFELVQVVPSLRWLFWPMPFGCAEPSAGWHSSRESGANGSDNNVVLLPSRTSTAAVLLSGVES
jgi:hypothetical protein